VKSQAAKGAALPGMIGQGSWKSGERSAAKPASPPFSCCLVLASVDEPPSLKASRKSTDLGAWYEAMRAAKNRFVLPR